jgi:hypothetical protein
MARLVLGPLLRYAGETGATVWVETDASCEVEVRAGGATHRSPTFAVEGHHYALVRLKGLEPGSSYAYTVALDGEEVWPGPGSDLPASTINTIARDRRLRLAFGSCRISVPHEPPYTEKRGFVKRGGASGQRFERDALYALATEIRRQPEESRPDALLLLGDQIYADEASRGARDFIRSRRDPKQPPGEEVADFEEYTRLYWDAWKEPAIRWLLSTVPSAMIFDDHDVHDDWNTSKAWLEKMRAQGWWEERIVGAFMSYWVYQHLGNLSPEELEEDELFGKVRSGGDATRALREFAYKADREVEGTRWSFHRDFGRVRLIVMDSRAGRVLEEEHRSMVDADEWAWIEEKTNGDFDHLVFGTSLPVFVSHGLHHFEAWNEAVCRGAWGRLATRMGESVRQALDLEHWAAFHDSFDAFVRLLREVGSGERSHGRPPASVSLLSGDVHHGYLAEVSLAGSARPVYQAVGSPLRNPLGFPERLALGAGWTGPVGRVAKALARLASVEEPPVSWRLVHEKPWFDNHVSTLEFDGREAVLRVERTTPENPEEPRLYKLLEQRLA